MKFGPLVAALLSAALAALSPAAPAKAADKITIGMIGSPDTGGWLYYIGVAKGYFAAEGIEPDFIYVPTAPGVMQQLVAGSLDIVGVDGVVEPIHAVAKGAHVAILRMTSNTTPYEMIAKPTIASIKDLKGKTITIGGLMDINRIYLERIMQANGIKWGEYDVVVIGNSAQRFAALKSGSVDATMLVPPTAFTAEKDGFKNLAMIKDYAGDLPMASADVTTAWAQAHGDEARKLVAALDKSAAFFYGAGNRDAAIDILVGVSHADRDQVAQSYDLAKKIKMYSEENTISRTDLQHLIDAMKSIGDLEGVTVTPDQLVIAGLTKLTQ
jgi:NitT/TauT family transport system substrate-binding protein